jgi:hypothetical protein
MRSPGEWLRVRIREQKTKIQRGILSGLTSQRDVDALDALQRRVGSRAQGASPAAPHSERAVDERDPNSRS